MPVYGETCVCDYKGGRERKREIYIYTYTYIYREREFLSGPSLGFSKVIIWAKFAFVKTLFAKTL